MARVLLTISGVIEPGLETQIAHGVRPRADFLEMAHGLDADLMDYAAARRHAGKRGLALEKIGGMNLVLAWACFQCCNDYDVILTDSEGVGIPFALLCQRFGRAFGRHMMITHLVSVRKKMFFFDYLHVQKQVHTFFVYSAWQKKFIKARWQVPDARVVQIPFQVDTQFFAPERVLVNSQELIFSPGRASRDLFTLFEAVQGMDVRLVITAASEWSKKSSALPRASLPANVTVAKLTFGELRQKYADSRFVVIPLHSINSQDGITTILEAMAMERAVICSRTPGRTEAIVDGETGLYVEPGDPRALGQAIEYLRQNPDEAKRMGRAGRRRVEQMMGLECYVERFQQHVQAALVNAEI